MDAVLLSREAHLANGSIVPRDPLPESCLLLLAVTCDHLNFGTSAALEVVLLRRAHDDGNAACSATRFFTEEPVVADAADQSVRSWVSCHVREEADIENSKDKAKTLTHNCREIEDLQVLTAHP